MKKTSQPRARQSSSVRLRCCVGLLNFLHLKRIMVSGQQHLESISAEQRVIFATTHLGDLDVPAVISEAGKWFDVVIANESVQHSFTSRTRINTALHLAGIQNFLSVEYKDIEGHDAKPHFRAVNFVPMQRALESGKSVLIAAHNPVKKNELPRGGYGAVYICAMTKDAVIVPVTVDVQSSELLDSYSSPSFSRRPLAQLVFHPAMRVAQINRLEEFGHLAEKIHHDTSVSDEERAEYERIRQALQVESDKIMRVLASALPPHKRGAYGGVEGDSLVNSI